MESQQLMQRIVTTLDQHKASDIQVIGVSQVTSITDYFVIAEGNSSTQVKALTDYVEDALSKEEITPFRKEGYHSSTWILMDYGSVIVHVFQRDTRQYYDLERLWKDGEQVDISVILDCEEK